MIKEIWYTRCPVPNGFGLAVQLGRMQKDLKEQGITLRSLAESQDKAVRQAHFNQNLAHSVRHGGVIPPLVSISRGADIRIVGMSWAEQRELILVRADSPIRSVQDLKGARIGIARRDHESVDFWRALAIRAFQSALNIAKLKNADVEWVDLPVEDAFVDFPADADTNAPSLWGVQSGKKLGEREAHALIRGEVDAIFTHGSHAVDTKLFLGARTLIDLGESRHGDNQVHSSKPFLFTASTDLIRERRDLVDRLLAYSLLASEWAKQNRSHVRTIFAREGALPEELVEPSYSKELHQQFNVDLNSEYVDLLREQKDFLLAHGFLARDFKVEDYVDWQRLESARQLIASGEISDKE